MIEACASLNLDLFAHALPIRMLAGRCSGDYSNTKVETGLHSKESPVQVNISVRHGQLGADTQERIIEKVEKLGRFFGRLTAIEVTVDLEHRDAPHVELRASAEHTQDFVAREASGELFAGLDAVVHKLEQQLRKHKEKIQTGHRQPGRKQLEVPLESDTEAE